MAVIALSGVTTVTPSSPPKAAKYTPKAVVFVPNNTSTSSSSGTPKQVWY